ncbi:uncharacterized protein HD556DRAFT_1303854 [Suillus plorans]|uniref:Uncharacterized protein n=1 Tax=Suillus plorans TaxID=116603 RepID=A0A9P7DV38_9AGAM|nr:uncharacterized protein HD556DRAFT_1303854 [Suillus plorans]KAG1803866.1 hypothetical protein HD556DRAFT_1303854 [Suillus plorans]
MLFRRRRTFVDSAHRYPTIRTKPDPYTCVLERNWTYQQACGSCHSSIFFGQIVRLEDQSPCYQVFTGRISEIVVQYKDVLVVHVTPLHYKPKDEFIPPPVRLTLPARILSLPLHLRLAHWCKKHANRLTSSKATGPDAIAPSLEDFQKQVEGSESFGNSVEELGGEFLPLVNLFW